ncbi:MAG: response regulator transcription factor [Clostridiales bacterium]|nr:response regulator transcription factor [Clostridiales bacterium]
MKGLILLVEDNEQILRGNSRMLRRRGYETMAAMTLAEARGCMAEKTPTAIVLDIMLPDGSGLDFMRELRKTSAIPILLLTGLTTTEDIVRGLDDGGDDYLTKPYDFSVLIAHIEALLRRAAHIPDTLVKGALTLDIRANRAILGGVDMLLTQKEFAVLLLMLENEGQVLSTDYIYEKVWKQAPDNGTGSAVKNVISRIRKKLSGKFTIENDRVVDGYIITQIPV